MTDLTDGTDLTEKSAEIPVISRHDSSSAASDKSDKSDLSDLSDKVREKPRTPPCKNPDSRYIIFQKRIIERASRFPDPSAWRL